jgi:hypothetical protein
MLLSVLALPRVSNECERKILASIIGVFYVKFKTIFILFNAILIFSFSFIFIMPFLLLGVQYSLKFWSQNWPMVVFFIVVLAGFNLFFAMNWKLFTLLESEDWNALGTLLGDMVFSRKRYGRRTVRLLVNTALLRGDSQVIERLESVLREEKPGALRRDAVLFGAARLLRNDAAASERFLAEFADGKGVENPAWLRFYYSFSLVLCKRVDQALPRLEAMMGSRDPIMALLSAYFLGTVCAAGAEGTEKQRLAEAASARRAEIAGRYNQDRWMREVERAKSEVHIVILSRIIDEATAWLMEGREKAVT